MLRENAKLRRINDVLMDRVERSMDVQGTTAFGLFQAAIVLEKTVRERTEELSRVNAVLRQQIQERQAIEEELREAKTVAERASAAKSRFVAAASHDLLQPLNVARLFVDALVERERDPENAAITERLDAALDALETILNSLLEVSRLDAGALTAERSVFPIASLVERIAREYAPQAEALGLRFRVRSRNAFVETDCALLERIFRNLVGNALRYTLRGGVLVGCRLRGTMLRLEVWDTGVGIPNDKLGEIFQEFRRLPSPRQEQGKGLGLGLSIVERIAQLLDLRIDVRSVVGKGSMFAVELPRANAPADYVLRSCGRGARTPLVFRPLSGKCVLLVEDDRSTLEALSMAFHGWGCSAFVASEPDAAMRIAHEMPAAPDVIVADYQLQNGTGVEAVEGVRRHWGKTIPAVIVSADRSVEDSIPLRRSWFLAKPVHLARLRSLVTQVLS